MAQSEAHFAERARQIRLSAPASRQLKNNGFKTMGQYAYSIGQPVNLLETLNGRLG